MNKQSLLKRVTKKLAMSAYLMLGIEPITGLRIVRYPTHRLGCQKYGGWHVPLDRLRRGSVCYCAGAGEDISFDLELVRTGCVVFTIDPTPRAVSYVKKVGGVNLLPIGLWSVNTTMRFYAPKNPTHVSHSILNLQGTDAYFDASCMTVSSVMTENGHAKLALLKLDVEGAEYEIIKSVLSEGVEVEVICVEFDELTNPLDSSASRRIKETARALTSAGYSLIKVIGSNFTFLRI